ncbi:MAG: hypothetical protein ACRC8S_21070 [Fimbriiglobus sp.]
MNTWIRRGWVIIVMSAFMTVLTSLMGASAFRVDFGVALVLIVGPSLGPYVGFLGPIVGYEADPVGEMVLMSVLPICMIASHPLNPRWYSALICAFGVFVWYLMGIVYLYQGA